MTLVEHLVAEGNCSRHNHLQKRTEIGLLLIHFFQTRDQDLAVNGVKRCAKIKKQQQSYSFHVHVQKNVILHLE